MHVIQKVETLYSFYEHHNTDEDAYQIAFFLGMFYLTFSHAYVGNLWFALARLSNRFVDL